MRLIGPKYSTVTATATARATMMPKAIHRAGVPSAGYRPKKTGVHSRFSTSWTA